jgi:hypothetical protein
MQTCLIGVISVGLFASNRLSKDDIGDRPMSRRTHIMWLTIAVTFVLSFGTAWGRIIDPWPYDRLFKNADLVIIATALSVRDAPEVDKTTLRPEDRNYLVGVVTTLQVEHVVKGEYKDTRLTLPHFRLKDGPWTKDNSHLMNDGPMLVKFSTDRLRLKGPRFESWEQAKYMLFLKKTKDGHFECVSGQFDPKMSAKLLVSFYSTD